MIITPRRKIVRKLMEDKSLEGLDLLLLDILSVKNLFDGRRSFFKIDGNLDVLTGVIRPQKPLYETMYYSVKTFLSFKDNSGLVPCFVAQNCMVPKIINKEVVLLEWRFVWREKRGEEHIAYLEINKLVLLEDESENSSHAQLSCLNVHESIKLLTKSNLENSSNSFTCDIVGRICAVSETYRISTDDWAFYIWIEDLDTDGDRVFVLGDLTSFMWLQSCLKLKGTYVFTNLTPKSINIEDKIVCGFAFTELSQVKSCLVESSKLSDVCSYVSCDEMLKMFKVSPADSDSNNDSTTSRLELPRFNFERMTNYKGVVAEAEDSRFGLLTLSDGVKIYMQMSGQGNFEHVRVGCEITLENIHFYDESIHGCRLSRVVVLSFPSHNPDVDKIKMEYFSEDKRTLISYRILSELIEMCTYMNSTQLINLFEVTKTPKSQFCPDLISKFNYKTFLGIFTTTVLKKKPSNDADEHHETLIPSNDKFHNTEISSIPIPSGHNFYSHVNKFISGYHDSIRCNSDEVQKIFGQRYNKQLTFLTIAELNEFGRSGELLRLLERVEDYYECKIMSSRQSNNSVFLLGILKKDDEKGCLSLVDSTGIVECVMADVSDFYSTLNFCFESESCKTDCKLSHVISQLPSCPYSQPCHIDCLIRIDCFFLITETFHSYGEFSNKAIERRYLVFSGVDLVSFGPQSFLEMGVSSYPSLPFQDDANVLQKLNFSPTKSEWTPFNLSFDSNSCDGDAIKVRFSQESLFVSKFLKGCKDFSYKGYARWMCENKTEKNQIPDSCTCSVSLVFVVQHKDQLVIKVKKPKDFNKSFNLEEFRKDYLQNLQKDSNYKVTEPPMKQKSNSSCENKCRDFGHNPLHRDDSSSDNGDGKDNDGRERMEPTVQQPKQKRYKKSDLPSNWKSLESLAPPPLATATSPEEVKFFKLKTYYQFGVRALVVDFVNDVCQFCLSKKNLTRHDQQYKQVFGHLDVSTAPKEVLLILGEECAGWHPIIHVGCVYKIEIDGQLCSSIRQYLRLTTENLPVYLRSKSLVPLGWKCVIEMFQTTGVTIKRSYKSWYSICHRAGGDESNLERNIKSAFNSLSKLIQFQHAGRIILGGNLETLVGIVIAKRFNVSKNLGQGDYAGQDSHSTFDLLSRMRASVPGIRNIVITIHLLGTEEVIKVSIPNNKIYKYSLGVITGCCVCFRQVLCTNFSGSGKQRFLLYNFLPISSLEVVSFPLDPFKPVNNDSITGFVFKMPENRSPGGSSRDKDHHPSNNDDGDDNNSSNNIRRSTHIDYANNINNTNSARKTADNTNNTTDNENINPSLIDSATLFVYSQSQWSSSPMTSTQKPDSLRCRTGKKYLLRDLLYEGDLESQSTPRSFDVQLCRPSHALFAFSCPRHEKNHIGRPDAPKLCQNCDSLLDQFSAKFIFDACDSTFKASTVCNDALVVKKLLDLSEQEWEELKNLIDKCPSRKVDIHFPTDLESRNYEVEEGPGGDAELFIKTLVYSEVVQRRLNACACRFRALLDQDGVKSSRVFDGPRPINPRKINLFSSEDGTLPEQELNACRSLVASLEGIETEKKLYHPMLTIELKDVDEIDCVAQYEDI